MDEKIYENFEKQDLINVIEYCHNLFDEMGIVRNSKGTIYSVYGRLCIYKSLNDEKIAALEARLKEAEEVIKYLSVYKNYVTDGDVKTEGGSMHVSDYCAAFIKGGDTI